MLSTTVCCVVYTSSLVPVTDLAEDINFTKGNVIPLRGLVISSIVLVVLGFGLLAGQSQVDKRSKVNFQIATAVLWGVAGKCSVTCTYTMVQCYTVYGTRMRIHDVNKQEI